ncbi:MAG TPA: hypothetical protein VLI39_07655 [Sedimentisphaerales bacterium]|nr:hypothetical protein [Sedimentisphaerales bacterium]
MTRWNANWSGRWHGNWKGRGARRRPEVFSTGIYDVRKDPWARRLVEDDDALVAIIAAIYSRRSL